jgi:hypothetical protein
MSDNPQPENQTIEEPRSLREGQWALPVEHLHSKDVKADMNVNVDGKQLAGPLRGFGQMWQKTYRIRFSGAEITPQEIIQVWKDNFGRFWPRANRFFSAGTSIQAGEVAVLNLAGPYGLRAPGGKGLVSTGVLVIYTDDESFSFMTPEGHIFGGMITFSAAEDISADETDGGGVSAQIQALVRANDPLYELGARVGVVHSMEDAHWKAVLENLAAHFGAQGEVTQENKIIDPGLQWKQAGNIRHNAAIHTGIYLAFTPFRWLAGLFRRKPESE